MEPYGAALVLEDETVSSASERFEKWPDMIEGSRGIGVGSMVEGAVGAAALAAMHPGSRSAPGVEEAIEFGKWATADQRQRAVAPFGQIDEQRRQPGGHLNEIGARGDFEQGAIDIEE